MKFLSGKKKEQLAVEAAEKQNAKDKQEMEWRKKKRDWIVSVPLTEILNTFDALEEKMKGVVSGKYRNDSDARAHAKALIAFNSIKKEFLEIDRHSLYNKDAADMYDVLKYDLPKAVNVFQQCCLMVTIHETWYEMLQGSTHIYAVFQKVLIRITNVHLREQAAGFDKASRVTKTQEGGFPQFKSDNTEIMEKLHELEKLWQEAFTQTNTVENEYFLEQTVLSYLPEAWNLYETFKNASEKTRKNAESILIEQLELITEHIAGILETLAEQSLAAMRSQTDFLKAKTAPASESSLRLK